MFSQIKSGLLPACHSLYYGEFPSVRVFLQFVRWKRKPIWAPIAKSKLFRIPERIRLPEEEERELRRLYNIYRTEMKSIRSYLQKEHQERMNELPEQNMQIEDEELTRALKINDIWNKEVKAIREIRLAKEEDEEKKNILEHMILADQQAQDNLKLLDSIVKQEKGKSSSFITPDKLDEAIEYALANPVDYNYSIDLEGNTVYGLKPKPDVVQKALDQKMSTT